MLLKHLHALALSSLTPWRTASGAPLTHTYARCHLHSIVVLVLLFLFTFNICMQFRQKMTVNRILIYVLFSPLIIASFH